MSEKIALGMTVKASLTGENLYDQRLFNQSAGMGSGLAGDDDSYGIYDKPLFNRAAATSVYRYAYSLLPSIYICYLVFFGRCVLLNGCY